MHLKICFQKTLFKTSESCFMYILVDVLSLGDQNDAASADMETETDPKDERMNYD